MRRFCLLAFLLITFSIPSLAQDQPVPAYVTQQNFPDSVGAVSIVDLDGTRLTFAEMISKSQGKKIMLDIWASWCRDCIVGIPKLQDLQKSSNPSEVDFVFLSVDEDDAKWRKAIKKFGMNGKHYRIEGGWKNPLASYIVLDWVPRYIVINEQGRVMMPKAIVADDKALESALMTK